MFPVVTSNRIIHRFQPACCFFSFYLQLFVYFVTFFNNSSICFCKIVDIFNYSYQKLINVKNAAEIEAVGNKSVYYQAFAIVMPV